MRALRRDHHRHRRGRRHARPPARALRQADPAARARRLPAARARELGQPRGLRQATATCHERASGYDKDGAARSSPHQQYFVGGNTKFYGAILFRLRERDFERGPPLRRRLAGLAALLRRPRALLHRGRAALPRPRRRRGEDPTEPPALRRRSRTRPSRTSRASSSSHDDFARTGHHPFHLPVGVDLDETDPEAGRCVRCDRFDGFPCLADGKADAHVLCVRPGARRTPNVTLRTHAQRRAARDRRLRRARSPRWSSTAAASEERYSADVVVVSCGAVELGGAAAALGLRPAPERARQLAPTRSGRNYMAHINSGVIAISQTPNDDEVPEDARRQRLLLGRRRLRAPARAHPDARQDRPQHPARRRAVVRPGPRARLHGQARDRLLAHDRGPAAPRQPRHGRPRRARSTSPRRTTTTRRTGGCCAS